MGNDKVRKVERASIITIEDGKGNKFFVHGSIGGLTVKQAVAGSRKKNFSCIVGLDSDWIGKKILCIMLEG